MPGGKRDLERFPTRFGYPTWRMPGHLKPRRRDPDHVNDKGVRLRGPKRVDKNRTRQRRRRRFLSRAVMASRRINRGR